MDPTQASPSGDAVGEERDRVEPAETAKQMATAAGATVKQEIASFTSSAQDKVQAAAEDQRQTAAKAIGGFATAIQHAGDELAANDQSMAAHLIKQAGDRLSDLAHTVSDKRPEEVLQSLREFSRGNPVAFAAVSALAGFAIGRLVRSGVEPMDPAPSDAAAGAIKPTLTPQDNGPSFALDQGGPGSGTAPNPQPDLSSGARSSAPIADGQSSQGGPDDDLL